MSTEEEKLLKEARKLPWDERLFHKNWKVRNEANIDLASVCDSITDPKDPRLRDFGPLFKKTVADSNAPVQEKALDALVAFLKAADADAGRHAKEVCDAVVAKCLTGRPKTVEKAQSTFILWVELEAAEAFLESMEKAIKNKVSKAVVPAIDVMFQALSEFGAKVVPPKKILKMLPELFDHQDQNVRASSKGLTLELCRWIGKEAVKSILFEKMRDTMIKELETELANVIGTAKPTRKIRSEQDKEPEQEIVTETRGTGASDESVADAPQEIDEYELVDPVDILTPLGKSGFWDGVKATKWSERRDAVAEHTKLASTKKIAPGDFTEICRALKKPRKMSVEEIKQRLCSIINAETISQLKSSVWKERLAAIGLLKQEVENVKLDPPTVMLLIRLLCVVPGWAEKNVQVQQQVIEVITYMASTVKRFPKECVVLCLSGISERLADIKTRAHGMKCLTTFSEAVGSGFIFDRLYTILKEHKNPKVLSEGLLWMVSILEDFGIFHIKLKDLIDFCKETGLQSSSAATRNSTIKLIGVLHRLVGPDIKGFLSDVKPTLLSTLEAECEKNPYEAPKKIVVVSDSTSSTSVGFNGLPREDISAKIRPNLLNNHSSSDWKVLLEFIDSINKIHEEAHKRIQPAGTTLRGRLCDSNKNLVMATLTTSAIGLAVEKSIVGMKVVCHELTRAANDPDSSLNEDLVKEIDKLVSCLATMVPRTFNLSFFGFSSRSCEYVLNTLMQTFQIKRLAHAAKEGTLDILITELLLWLLDERVPLMDEGSKLLKALNVLMLKILDNTERTSSFVVLIRLLRPLDPSRWPNPPSTETLANRNQKFSDLVVKCLVKLTEVLESTIYDVDLDRVLHIIHVYLQELGMEEIRKRAGADDKPLRMVKTVLHELVKLRGAAIKGHLSMLPIDSESQPIILVYIDQILQTLAAARMLTPTGPIGKTHSGDAASNNTTATTHSFDALLKQELAAVFKKIGDKKTCTIGLYELYRITQLYPKVYIFAQLQNVSEAFRTCIIDGLAQMGKNAATGRMSSSLPMTTPPTLSMNYSSPKFGAVSPVHTRSIGVKPDNNYGFPVPYREDDNAAAGATFKCNSILREDRIDRFSSEFEEHSSSCCCWYAEVLMENLCYKPMCFPWTRKTEEWSIGTSLMH